MANGNNNTVESRIRRWRELVVMDQKKNCMFLVDCNEGMPSRPLLWPDKRKERIDWALEKYEVMSERIGWLHDDAVPHLDVATGTEIFAEAFGCKVYRPEDDMPSARPLVYTAAEASKLDVPDLDSSPLTILFEMADELRSRAGKDIVFKLPDIQSPMDIAALIWNKTDFYVATVDEPDAVKELAAKVSVLLTAFLDRWFERYGKNFIAHCPTCYMESGYSVSEDEVGIVSAATFEEFFLPELSMLSKRYGGMAMHCCANSRHQWSNFRKIPGLRILNIHQPGNLLNEAVKFFADFTVQNHFESFTEGLFFDGKPVWEWPGMMPENAHMLLNATMETKAEAIGMCDKLNRACGRQSK